MKRREMLSRLAAGSYSLIVLADRIPAAAAPPGPTGPIRDRLAATVPSPTAKVSGVPGAGQVAEMELQTDLLVAGGGLAGVCTAIAAARHGARVILVQDRSRLGGNSSSEVKMHVCGSHAQPGWRETGLVEELRIEDAVRNPQRSFEIWDLMLYDKVISEPNITLLLDSTLCSARREGDRIAEVLVRCDKTETVYRIKARFFCDSTGDSRLGLEAGADMREGREARSEFDEPLAVEKADGETLGSSILFTSRVFPEPMPFIPPAWARKVTREHLRYRGVPEWDYGYWWIAWGGNQGIIRNNERIRFELLSIVMGVWDYIKNSGDFPDSRNWAMDWVGMVPGKRGSRRMLGDHILTQNDILRGDIEDAVSIGGWPLDDHPPGGFDRYEIRPNVAVALKDAYNIPLRSLYSRNIANLFMAGRNISCTHVAFTSARVMATCAAAGQAAGTAAALCLAGGLTPRQLFQDKARLEQLQQTLLRDDQTIKNRVNRDPLDLARKARVSASGEEPGAPAAKVLDGHLRDIPRPPDTEVHQWNGRMGAEGAWVELAWAEPQTIRHIQLTFDTGLKRRLMLSGSAAVTKGQIRAPQPETVRDYRILSRAAPDAGWKEVVAVGGNYQRQRRHDFDAVTCSALRIQIDATHGDGLARIYEVRCYA